MNFLPNSCDACHKTLNEMYIVCAECVSSHPNHLQKSKICVDCFASGAEYANHSSSHSYKIVHCCVKVFLSSTWSANEDCALLELIERHGFGNWPDISRSLNLYSQKECQNHYMDHYFDGIFRKSCNLTKSTYNPLRVPYLFHCKTFDPPRCQFDFMQNKFTSNYHFARSEFDTPFDRSAENVINNIEIDNKWDKDSQKLSNELSCALVVAYNNRLR